MLRLFSRLDFHFVDVAAVLLARQQSSESDWRGETLEGKTVAYYSDCCGHYSLWIMMNVGMIIVVAAFLLFRSKTSALPEDQSTLVSKSDLLIDNGGSYLL